MKYGFDAVIALHLAAALAALAVGALAFAARKGSHVHRLAGRGWVALMLVAALSSFWIQTKGHFTWIHLLSVAVPLLLAAGVVFAVRGNVRGHRTTMASIYVLGLGVAGVFTLLPHRLLGKMLWSSLGLI
ncbi:MAG: DUF2306 domain-containing protein [Betaproteobacteria bacterium]|nr:DUF2306 domain-containing protein [Betaproteobacteria bacterium]MDH4325318.1 DUF2306 domain-containing protein [Betaproteobacteria bacterium]MDH5578005.1 DUF2306 domain-containing protein [Betaproteobacteria bacterium]